MTDKDASRQYPLGETILLGWRLSLIQDHDSYEQADESRYRELSASSPLRRSLSSLARSANDDGYAEPWPFSQASPQLPHPDPPSRLLRRTFPHRNSSG